MLFIQRIRFSLRIAMIFLPSPIDDSSQAIWSTQPLFLPTKMKHLEHKETKKNTSKRHSQLGGSTQIFSPFFFWEVQISPSNLPTKSSQVSNHPNHQPPQACQSERPGSIEDVQAALEDGAEASFGHLMWVFQGLGDVFVFFVNSFCDW